MTKAIRFTPETLKAVYDMLCTVPPFDKWNMPDSDEMHFTVCRSPNKLGWCVFSKNKWSVAISIGTVTRLNLLICTMMHEMIHVHEGNVNIDRNDVQHSRAFKKWAAQVCDIHNLDPYIF